MTRSVYLAHLRDGSTVPISATAPEWAERTARGMFGDRVGAIKPDPPPAPPPRADRARVEYERHIQEGHMQILGELARLVRMFPAGREGER